MNEIIVKSIKKENSINSVTKRRTTTKHNKFNLYHANLLFDRIEKLGELCEIDCSNLSNSIIDILYENKIDAFIAPKAKKELMCYSNLYQVIFRKLILTSDDNSKINIIAKILELLIHAFDSFEVKGNKYKKFFTEFFPEIVILYTDSYFNTWLFNNKDVCNNDKIKKLYIKSISSFYMLLKRNNCILINSKKEFIYSVIHESNNGDILSEVLELKKSNLKYKVIYNNIIEYIQNISSFYYPDQKSLMFFINLLETYKFIKEHSNFEQNFLNFLNITLLCVNTNQANFTNHLYYDGVNSSKTKELISIKDKILINNAAKDLNSLLINDKMDNSLRISFLKTCVVVLNTLDVYIDEFFKFGINKENEKFISLINDMVNSFFKVIFDDKLKQTEKVKKEILNSSIGRRISYYEKIYDILKKFI